jgi:hypothetical protein
MSRIRGTRRILEDTRGHDDPPIGVRECTRGHVGVRTSLDSWARVAHTEAIVTTRLL